MEDPDDREITCARRASVATRQETQLSGRDVVAFGNPEVLDAVWISPQSAAYSAEAVARRDDLNPPGL